MMSIGLGGWGQTRNNFETCSWHTELSVNPMSTHYQAASSLLASKGLTGSQHTVLRENLAHYNAQLSDPIFDEMELMALDRTAEESRWTGKLQRDLNKPYTDAQVGQQLEKLDQDLKTLLQVGGTPFPRTLYVTGSVTKGRFGGNSDLDVLGEGLLSEKGAGYLAALPGWKVSRTVDPEGQTLRQSVTSPAGMHVDFLTRPEFEKLSNWFGRRVEIDVEQARQGHSGVKEAVQQSFEAKGYAVHWKNGALQLEGQGTPEPVLEPALPYPLNLPRDQGYRMEEVAGKPPTLLDRWGDWLHST